MNQVEEQVKAWENQEQIDLLVESGFAEVSERFTRQWQVSGFMHVCYVWTPAGKEACWQYANSTPMAWAHAMSDGTVRYCIHCGRCTAYRKVAEHFTDRADKRTVCKECGAKGLHLPVD